MRFIESILYKDGKYYNLDLHQERLDRTFERFMPAIGSHDLHRILPELKMDGTYKVRVVYDADSEDADYDLEFAEYIPRSIQTLQVVDSKPFDYSFKFEDRNKINRLLTDQADDIIISIDGKITDGSYFNLAFWDGQNWLTPDTSLLKGVRRTQLLKEGKIKVATIHKTDIPSFEKVALINAMMDLGSLELPIANITF